MKIFLSAVLTVFLAYLNVAYCMDADELTDIFFPDEPVPKVENKSTLNRPTPDTPSKRLNGPIPLNGKKVLARKSQYSQRKSDAMQPPCAQKAKEFSAPPQESNPKKRLAANNHLPPTKKQKKFSSPITVKDADVDDDFGWGLHYEIFKMCDDAMARYDKAIAKGDARALYKKAFHLESGPCDCATGCKVKKDLALAKTYYEEAAAAGCPDAQFRIAFHKHYKTGGFLHDSDGAIAGYDQAFNSGIIEAANYLGHLYEKLNRSADAFKSYRKAYEAKSPDGARYLGVCYLEGIGVEIDLEKAQTLLEEAARMHAAEANLSLGILWEKAAGAGILEALLDGSTVINKPFTPKNIEVTRESSASAKTFNDFFLLGPTDATHFLAYLNLPLLKQNLTNDTAYKAYVNFLLKLSGNLKDRISQALKLGFEYQKKAADVGLPEGLFNVAVCYEEAIGVEQNLNLARDYFSKAKESGHPDAERALSEL